MRTVALTLGLLLMAPLAAEEKQQRPTRPDARASQTPPSQAIHPGLTGAAARRNENVQVNRIDNDALKESNVRLGDNVTIVPEPPVEVNYWATEHGRPPGEPVVLRSTQPLVDWHGEVFGSLQNSVFNARTFFQVGGVRPSRQNSRGLRFGGPVRHLGSITGSFTQRKVRGMVNGNVLVPLDAERTSTAADPAVRRLVERFFAAYPDVLPNRPDFDSRALNTNSRQRIDDTTASLRLDRKVAGTGGLSLSHLLNRQRIDAFELVAGQNPDTELHSHRTQATYRQNLNPSLEMALAAGFARQKSVLLPEPNAVGPRVRFGYQIEELGPDSMFPINRAVNTFRWGAVFTHKAGGPHRLTFGADGTRTQLNGIETANQRGLFWFSNNFGRTAIENLRIGTPTTYEVTIGEMSRGFRNLGANFFVGDQWKLSSRLQIYYGLRYNVDSTPVEVNGRSTVPYGCDCNNFSPRFSVAWRLGGNRVLRTGYTVSFGGLSPVTYGQVRYNMPNARYIVVQNPDLLNPLQGIDLKDPNGRSSPIVLARNLVSPYAHQYNFSLEDRIARSYFVRVGYIGSRTFKLLDSYQLNRAVPVPGIPLTTATVNQRRPDARYYDIKYIVNAGAAYMDAAQVALESAVHRGLAWSASYTFGKALDTGADYSFTGANNDINKGRSQGWNLAQQDRKGLSNFDSTHAVLLSWSYQLPRASSAGRLGLLINGWQVTGTSLMKSGTPLTLYVGSDAPGFGNVDGGSGDRPNIVDPSILGTTIGNPNTAPLILRRDRFAYIVPGEARGNLGRGTFRKSPIANFNAAASKRWRWDGRREWSLLLRAEAFNLTNHPQFDEPQRNLSSPAFGKITNTLNDGRVLQFSLRLVL